MTATRTAVSKRRILVTGIVVAWTGLTYQPHWGWWISGVAAAVILILGRLAFGSAWRTRFGLATGARGALVFAGAVAILLPLSVLLIQVLARAVELSFSVQSILDRSEFLAFTFFQTLNEELVIGALLLLSLDRRFPGRRGWIAIGTAALFALMHFTFYASPHQEMLYGTKPVALDPLTVLTLFCVGLTRNATILMRGDIAVAWALHLSFNIPFFVGRIRSADGSAPLGEPEQFDAILGQPVMAIGTTVVAIGCLWLLRRSRSGA